MSSGTWPTSRTLTKDTKQDYLGIATIKELILQQIDRKDSIMAEPYRTIVDLMTCFITTIVTGTLIDIIRKIRRKKHLQRAIFINPNEVGQIK